MAHNTTATSLINVLKRVVKKKQLNACRFGIYKHDCVTAEGLAIQRQLIVLRLPDNSLQFTNYHKYIKSTRKATELADDGNNRTIFVVQLLNYCYFVRNIRKFDEVTTSDVQMFLSAYGLCDLPWSAPNSHHSKATLDRCVQVIFDFVTAYVKDKQNHSKIRLEDLYQMVDRRNKEGRVIQVKEPVLEIRYPKIGETPLLRDIPNKAFLMLFNHITLHHTDILGATTNCAFGGLRGAEACNVRRPDSPLGPGIMVTKVDGEIVHVEIDLRAELCLRSDGISVGRIKKERIQQIPDIFLNAYVHSMEIYAEYMEGRNYEVQYGPLSVNRQGKAMTVEVFRQHFQTAVREMIPVYLADSDPEIVEYGRVLQGHTLSPHVLRHWFTVQLVLSGISEPATLAYWRGDKSLLSALTYLQNKGELFKKYKKVNNEMFEFLTWAADKKRMLK